MKHALRVGGRRVEVESNFADRIVNYFDPILGRQRYAARLQMAWAGWNGGYDGASKSKRSLQEWNPAKGDADADQLPALRELRDRSSDLLRNAPLAVGARATHATNIIGTGIRLHARIDQDVLALDDERAQAIERQLEREWRLWAETTECDITRTSNIYDLQTLVFISQFERGDVFVSMLQLPRAGSVYSLRLQVIEADRICNPNFAPDSERMAGGVERTEFGAPVAYHVSRQHPDSRYPRGKFQWDRLPAFGEKTGRRNVLHLFTKIRPGQTRGVPELAPVIHALKQLTRYTEAEIDAAVVNSFLTVFIKTESGQGLAPMAETGGTTADEDFKLGPAAMLDLRPGESVDVVEPKRPNESFDPFVLAVLRQIGVALELPYEVLVKHFQASYSAARAALLEAWKTFTKRRQFIAMHFCQPVYEALVFEAVAYGRLHLPGFLAGDPMIRAAYLGARWIGPARGMINESNEVEAARSRVEGNLSTLQEETAQLTGGDWESNLQQRARETKLIRAAGLAVESDAERGRTGAAEPDRRDDEPEKGDEEDETEKDSDE